MVAEVNNEEIKNTWGWESMERWQVQLDVGQNAVKLASSGQITRQIETERSLIKE